ncbi:MAG: methyl-accepting chemotaxis protein [Spirochaetales bacterium]|nr:methyl-accepting chemotaxis protein [Spirochaetales bacterium]
MHIRRKLSLGLSTLLILSAAMGLTGLIRLRQGTKAGLLLGTHYAPRTSAVLMLTLEATRAHLLLEEIFAGNTDVSMDKVHLHIDKSLLYANAILEGGMINNRRYRPTKDGEVRRLLILVKSQIEAYKRAAESRYNLFLRNSDSTQANTEFLETYAIFVSIAEKAEELIYQKMEGQNSGLERLGSTSLIIMGAWLFVIGAIAIAIGVALSRRISRPLSNMLTLFKAGSGGDLTVRSHYDLHDEIGEMSGEFNGFMSRLQSIVQDIKGKTQRLSSVAERLTFSAETAQGASQSIGKEVEQSAERLESQAAQMDQTASAVEEMARNIDSLDSMVEEQVASITESSASMEEMIASVSMIANRSQAAFNDVQTFSEKALIAQDKMQISLEHINRMSALSSQLEETNDVVSSIAAQTNLLAMNAAIEAAHAGEAGRGFSVVADEIRKLAEHASEQSKESGERLKQIAASIKKVVGASSETNEALVEIGEFAHSTSGVFQEFNHALEEQKTSGSSVLEELRRMRDFSQSVREGSEEMKEGNQQVIQAVSTLRNTSSSFMDSFWNLENQKDSVLETVEHINSAAEGTAGMVGELNQVIASFQLEEQQESSY